MFKLEGIEIERGLGVVSDGIDGSGKGEVIKALEDFASECGKKIFDVNKYQHLNDRLPTFDEFKDHDVLISAEPTFSWVGAGVRYEITGKNGRHYSGLSTAWGYGLDREILIKRVESPAIEHGIDVFKERSFSTTIIYQVMQKDGSTLEEVMAIPGNKIAKIYRPNLLIIPYVSEVEIALQRTSEREKDDDCRWEELDFLELVNNRYLSDWFRDYFKGLGTDVRYIDTSGTLEETHEQSVDAFMKYLEKSGNLKRYINTKF